MMMMVVAEGDDEADFSTPLGPGLLTPTSGPYESQQVVSSSCIDYAAPHPPSPLFLQSQARNELHVLWGKTQEQRQQSTSLSGDQGNSG